MKISPKHSAYEEIHEQSHAELRKGDHALCRVFTLIYLVISTALLVPCMLDLPLLYEYKLYEPGVLTVVNVAILASNTSTACCDPACIVPCAKFTHEVVETYSWVVDTPRCAFSGIVVYNKTLEMGDFVNNTGVSFDGYYSVCPFEPVGEVDRDRCAAIQTSTIMHERVDISFFLGMLITWCILTMLFILAIPGVYKN
jgi:hypothetical protein